MKEAPARSPLDDPVRALIWTALASLAFLLSPTATEAHEWYPYSCCSGRDCHPVDASAVQLTPSGWWIRNTGETIPFSKARFSPDGQFHICSYGGLPDGKTICLFTPDFGS